MKRRRAIFLLCLTLLTASCGIMKPRNAVVITDHEEMMAILQEHFPDLYVLHDRSASKSMPSTSTTTAKAVPTTNSPSATCPRTSTER